MSLSPEELSSCLYTNLTVSLTLTAPSTPVSPGHRLKILAYQTHAPRLIHGSTEPDSFRFWHWQDIHMMVYYSTRHSVTMPPPGYISAGHLHGIPVLGSVRGMKWDADILTHMDGNITQQLASKLATIAEAARFDGWVISTASDMKSSFVPAVWNYLEALASEMRRTLPGSILLWYDSLDTNGKSVAHSEIRDENAPFFKLADGMILSTQWTVEKLATSGKAAGGGKDKVYAGIDLYARDTWYPGGHHLGEVLQLIKKHGLSAAIFFASWAFEAHGRKAFTYHMYRLSAQKDGTTYINSDFNLETKVMSYVMEGVKPPSTWMKRTMEEGVSISPQAAMQKTTGAMAKLKLVLAALLFHQPSRLKLRILFKDRSASTSLPLCESRKPWFWLFGFDLPLSPLEVQYTFKNLSLSTDVTKYVTVVLKATSPNGEAGEFHLGMIAVAGDSYDVKRLVPRAASSEPSSEPWVTRLYHADDKREQGATLEEIGILVLPSRGATQILLGELIIKRPGDGTEENSVASDFWKDVFKPQAFNKETDKAALSRDIHSAKVREQQHSCPKESYVN
ncbi:cytosolic endo-beta-N-acetylglucosaminidase [Rhipicephalus sanguineus]|uniref:cytosolic endo-beta-N-acetylglucosaminidase n=1 Tax=Rhipicephalus sanguineus TaxID=34632 RepID=UPI0018930353|nr:cytosolic endo-beta-N-acetylglucosaminidase [Rhipicephalus sanguineus]